MKKLAAVISGLFAAGTLLFATPAQASTARTLTVSTDAELKAAISAAQAGDTVLLADGDYRNIVIADKHGTPQNPILIKGGSGAHISTGDISIGYGVHFDHSSWITLMGVSIDNSKKGIMMDASDHLQLTKLTITQIGEEAVRFRTCTTQTTLMHSTVADSGLLRAGYGEGIYVGSFYKDWTKFGCAYDGDLWVDASDGNIIQNNLIRNTTAEGIDLKEGVNGAVVKNNVFDNTGFSGENAGDSPIDLKSNGVTIQNNLFINPTGAVKDAIQIHDSGSFGYGNYNVLKSNTFTGPFPGFGIAAYDSGLRANVVFKNNRADGPALGLLGDRGMPVAPTK